MNFVRTRSVIEKLVPISEITMYGQGCMGYYFMNHTFSFVIQHPLFNLHTS